MSVSGKPFHNVALDEGHECVINKRLKLLTSRPSEYRTVTLSNFMAYLDKYSENLEKCIMKSNKQSKTSSIALKYVKRVSEAINTAHIFDQDENTLTSTEVITRLPLGSEIGFGVVELGYAL